MSPLLQDIGAELIAGQPWKRCLFLRAADDSFNSQLRATLFSTEGRRREGRKEGRKEGRFVVIIGLIYRLPRKRTRVSIIGISYVAPSIVSLQDSLVNFPFLSRDSISDSIVNLDRCFEKFSILQRRSKGIEERSFISFLVVEYRVFNWTREEEEKEDSAKMTIIINNK